MKGKNDNELKLIKDFITKINNGTINNKNKARNEFRKLKQKVTNYNLRYDLIKELEKDLIVCFYHVTYEFESESTVYSCLNVKELLARSRRHI